MAAQITKFYITDDYFDDPPDTVISLPALAREIDTQRYKTYKRRLDQIDDETPTRLPLLDAAWKHIHLEKKGKLLELILLFERLRDQLKETGTEVVVGDVTAEQYRALLRDVEAHCDVTVRLVDADGANRSLAETYATDLLSVMVLLASQCLWMVYRHVRRTDQPAETETLLFPYSGRESSTRPVVEALQRPSQVVVRSVFNLKNSIDDWGEANSASLSSFASVGTVLTELAFLFRFGREILSQRETEQILTEALRDEIGHDLEHAVRYAVRVGYGGNISNLVFAAGVDDLLNRVDCERVVVGGNSPGDRAILAVARDHSLDTYYVPHSIAHPDDQMYLQHPETTMFVASEFDREYLTGAFDDAELPRLVATGRPYFGQFSDGDDERADDELKVVLATQDGPDYVRRTFLETVLSGIEHCPINERTVVVKIHPDEDIAFYQHELERFDSTVVNQTVVDDSNLQTHLETADLVVTINSNVGLEAMYVGTPCVCVNVWEPIINTYPYASEGPAPVCRTAQEVREFFGGLSWTRLKALTEEQRSFAASYRFSDASETIAAHIEDRVEETRE